MYFKRAPFIKAGLFNVLAAILLLGLCACSGPKITTEPQHYTLSDQQVAFAPPPTSTWHKNVQEIPRGEQKSNKADDVKTDTIIRFTPPWPNAHLTVSALGDWPYASWEADPNATKDLVRSLQDQILKRSESEITKQSETELNNEKALRLDFHYLEGSTTMYGSQICVIHNKAFWTIAIIMPEANKAEGEAIFSHVIDTFKFE